MKEIEILVKVLESKKSALKKLSKFKVDHISYITDRYYYHQSHKGFLLTKNKSSTEILRTRIKDGKSYITYKKDVFTKTGWAYSDEYETEVKDAKIISDILIKLNFKPLVKVDNKRTIFYYKTYEICIEEVKGIGLFMEIECLKPGKRVPQNVRAEIFSLIEKIGIKVSKELAIGKTEMIYKKKRKWNGKEVVAQFYFWKKTKCYSYWCIIRRIEAIIEIFQKDIRMKENLKKRLQHAKFLKRPD